MLCRNLSEEDVKAMFSSFGSVDDVSILRNADGKSKGAAFVRMGSKDEAKEAITRLNNSQTMPVSTPYPSSAILTQSVRL